MASPSLGTFSFCFPAKPHPPSRASLASSSSIFISRDGKALMLPSNAALTCRRRREGGGGSSKRLQFRCLFGLGVPEIAVIAGVAALVFGPKQLPEIGRSIGKTVKSFQQAAKEFEMELRRVPEEEGAQPFLHSPNTSIGTVGAPEGRGQELEASGEKENN